MHERQRQLPPLRPRDVPMLLQPLPPLLQRRNHGHGADEMATVLGDVDADEMPHEKPNEDDGVVVAIGKMPPDDKPLLFQAFL